MIEFILGQKLTEYFNRNHFDFAICFIFLYCLSCFLIGFLKETVHKLIKRRNR